MTIGGGDAIGQLGNGLAKMFDNLRALLNNVQKGGIQVTTSATEIAEESRARIHAETSLTASAGISTAGSTAPVP